MDRTPTLIETFARRDRRVVVAGLVGVIALAWAYILAGAGTGMSPFASGMASAMTAPAAWSPGYALVMLAMWWVMMMAMMLPSAAPMILLFATVNRRRRAAGGASVATGVFAAGYVLAWGGFSLAAIGLQWLLERVALLSPAMTTSSVLFGGALLIAAGAYQFTPWKHACLRHCRTPFQFVMRHWREGRRGALAMGLHHGAFCLGCCWVLMGLLFYGGVMNLYWIVALAVFVLIEKTFPAGHRLSMLGGLGLIVWGGAVIAAGV